MQKIETLTSKRNLDYKNVTNQLVEWLKNYSDENNMETFVIGVSGGVDSGAVSTLVALTGKRVIALQLPIHQAKSEVDRADKHISWLKDNFDNVESITLDLTNTYESLKKINGINISDSNTELFEFTMSNTKARLRMTTLYQIAAQCKGLVCATGSFSEDYVGFATKFGDLAGDVNPMGDLMKSDVYEIAKELDLIPEIKNAIPTDGLHEDGRTDEDQLGASYNALEKAFYNQNKIKKGELREDDLSKEDVRVLSILSKRYTQNVHKLLPVPICKLK